MRFYLTLLCFLALRPLFAQVQISPMPYGTDEAITAIAASDSFIYIAGPHTWYKPMPYVALFDTMTKKMLPQPIKSNRAIQQIVSDGKDGFYICGDFDSINNLAIARIAHLKANFSLDSSWSFRLDQFTPTQALSATEIIEGDTMELFTEHQIHMLNGHLHLFLHRDRSGEYSSRKETSYWRLDAQKQEWVFLRYFPYGAWWVAENEKGAYLQTSYEPSEMLRTAPQRDTIFFYNSQDQTIVPLLRAKSPRTAELYAHFVEDKIHLISQTDWANPERVWLCFDKRTGAADTALTKKINEQLETILTKKNITDSLMSRYNFFSIVRVKPHLQIAIESDSTFYCRWLPKEQRFDCTDTLELPTMSFAFDGGALQNDSYAPSWSSVVNAQNQMLLVGNFLGAGGRKGAQLQRFHRNTLALDTLWKFDEDASIEDIKIINNKLFVNGIFNDGNENYENELRCFDQLDQAELRRIDLDMYFIDLYHIRLDYQYGNTLFATLTSNDYDYEQSVNAKKTVYKLEIGEAGVKSDKFQVSGDVERILVSKEGILAMRWEKGMYNIQHHKQLSKINKKGKVLLNKNNLYNFWQDENFLYWVNTEKNDMGRMNLASFKQEESPELDFWGGGYLFGGYFYEENYEEQLFNLIYYDFDKQSKRITTLKNAVSAQVYQIDQDLFLLETNSNELNGVKVPSGMAVLSIKK